MARLVPAVVERLARIMTQPLDELSRFQRTLRFLYDLGRHGARQLQHDRAPQMAGALAFRTLFALLPVLVLGTVLIRAFAGFEQLEGWLADLFTQLGLDDFQVTGATESAVAGGESISQWLLGLVGQVQEINIAAIGWVGLLVVIYSAIGLMVTIEKSFNIIYRAPEGRSWPRRLTIYWTVLTLGPGGPVGPVGPTEPTGPVGPIEPGGPGAPGVPVGPVSPIVRNESQVAQGHKILILVSPGSVRPDRSIVRCPEPPDRTVSSSYVPSDCPARTLGASQKLPKNVAVGIGSKSSVTTVLRQRSAAAGLSHASSVLASVASARLEPRTQHAKPMPRARFI